MADDAVQLTDLEVIQRWSLAVRSGSAARDEIVAALRADLAWLEGRRARPSARPAVDDLDQDDVDDDDDEPPVPARRRAPAPSRRAATPSRRATSTTKRTTRTAAKKSTAKRSASSRRR